ncbi:hypothetical protein Vadar_019993 [Vaccinium darrowii]|uniref:Uncharacterized protein n=1 Tax=Vaccinium darrowii TaxID=229202 RepID=A0ACB7Y192_9ERIC|nr:hypothetical protein Vadar_019993 [Vaccinium darrowii]
MAQFGPWMRASPATQLGRRRPTSPVVERRQATSPDKAGSGRGRPKKGSTPGGDPKGTHGSPLPMHVALPTAKTYKRKLDTGGMVTDGNHQDTAGPLDEGVGRPLTFHQLKELVRLHSPSLFFLSETKNGVSKLELIKRSLNMDGMLRVDPVGTAGGLALFWKNSISVTLEKFCDWFIDVRIFDGVLKKSWRLINVYFNSYVGVRHSQWEFFIRYKACLSEEWVIWGDMNDLLSEDEKCGGIPWAASSVRGFRNFVDVCGLTDLGFSGQPFTWQNNRAGEGFIQERLDRDLASHPWCNMYNHAMVTHIYTVGSDHCAIKLDLNPSISKMRAPFRFDARWGDDEGAHDVIQQAWSTQVYGSRFFSVFKKVQSCRVALTNWKRRKRGNEVRTAEEIKNKIAALNNGSSTPLIGEIQKLKARNRICGIERADGVWTNNPLEVQLEFRQFFSEFFAASPLIQHQETVEAIPGRVSDATNRILIKPATDTEIHEALMMMGPTKAPGIDGMTALFYQSCWDIVGRTIG